MDEHAACTTGRLVWEAERKAEARRASRRKQSLMMEVSPPHPPPRARPAPCPSHPISPRFPSALVIQVASRDLSDEAVAELESSSSSESEDEATEVGSEALAASKTRGLGGWARALAAQKRAAEKRDGIRWGGATLSAALSRVAVLESKLEVTCFDGTQLMPDEPSTGLGRRSNRSDSWADGDRCVAGL